MIATLVLLAAFYGLILLSLAGALLRYLVRGLRPEPIYVSRATLDHVGRCIARSSQES